MRVTEHNGETYVSVDDFFYSVAGMSEALGKQVDAGVVDDAIAGPMMGVAEAFLALVGVAAGRDMSDLSPDTVEWAQGLVTNMRQTREFISVLESAGNADDLFSINPDTLGQDLGDTP